MKTDIFFALAPLGLQLVAARPQIFNHHHHRRGIVTTTLWTTIDAPTEIVYVDEDGNTLSTGNGEASTVAPAATSATAPPSVQASAPTTSQAAPTPPPSPLVASSAAPFDAKVVSNPPTAPSSPAAPAQQASSSNAAPSPAAEPSSSDSSMAYGISWSPYTTKGGPCKTLDQANTDFAQMSGYSVVRVYGTDCNQVSNAIQAAKAHGKKLFAGIFDLNQISNEANIIVNAVKANGGDWSIFDTISVGNEDVGSKGASVESVKQAMNAAIPILRNAGYKGSIVHVDTNAAFLNSANVGICDPSVTGDYLAANTHAFFNPNSDAAGAGNFLTQQLNALQACANKASKKRSGGRVRITETGWPKQGQPNGQAVPSPQNQVTAIAAIKKSIPGDILFFSAFDAQWQDPGYLGIEQHWGILDNTA